MGRGIGDGGWGIGDWGLGPIPNPPIPNPPSPNPHIKIVFNKKLYLCNHHINKIKFN